MGRHCIMLEKVKFVFLIRLNMLLRRLGCVKIVESIHWFHGRMGIPFSTSNLFALQLEWHNYHLGAAEKCIIILVNKEKFWHNITWTTTNNSQYFHLHLPLAVICGTVHYFCGYIQHHTFITFIPSRKNLTSQVISFAGHMRWCKPLSTTAEGSCGAFLTLCKRDVLQKWYRNTLHTLLLEWADLLSPHF